MFCPLTVFLLWHDDGGGSMMMVVVAPVVVLTPLCMLYGDIDFYLLLLKAIT